MCARQSTLSKSISQALCLISVILSSSIIIQPQRSKATLTQSKASTWNTLYIIGPGIGGNSYGLSEIPARLTAIDLTTRREKLVLSNIYDAKLSPDGTLLYVASLLQPRIAAFDTTTGKERWQASLKDITSYSTIGTDFGPSPDNRFVYIPTHYGGNDNRPSRLRIVDATQRVELPDTIELPITCRGDVLTPPKGNFVYIHCSNKFILINTTTQAIQREYKLDLQEPVRALMFSPDGQWLYLFVGKNGLAIFDTEQGQVKRQVSFEPNPLLLNPLSVNGGVLLASSVDGKRLLVAQSLQERQTETEYRQTACLFRVFDTGNWRKIEEFKLPSPVFAVSINASGDTIYAVIAKKTRAQKLLVPNTVVELSANSGQIRRQFVRKNENIRRVLVGP